MSAAVPASERALAFECRGEQLVGVLSRPAAPGPIAPLALLILVGGPQYRAGSHRQFVQLARALAGAGMACLRFDYRGMGDSSGPQRAFDEVREDVDAGVAALCAAAPEVERCVVWGLCDAASAAMMFATANPRVAGIVAVNPWVRSTASLATATVKHYYRGRLLQAELWRKILGGRFDWRASLRSAFANVREALAARRGADGAAATASYQERMLDGVTRFGGHVLLLQSGEDLTAREFDDHCAADMRWQQVLRRARVERVDFPDADHTFSVRQCREAMERATIDWMGRVAAALDDRKGEAA